MKGIKRILAMLLVLVMVFSDANLLVFAQDDAVAAVPEVDENVVFSATHTSTEEEEYEFTVPEDGCYYITGESISGVDFSLRRGGITSPDERYWGGPSTEVTNETVYRITWFDSSESYRFYCEPQNLAGDEEVEIKLTITRADIESLEMHTAPTAYSYDALYLEGMKVQVNMSNGLGIVTDIVCTKDEDGDIHHTLGSVFDWHYYSDAYSGSFFLEPVVESYDDGAYGSSQFAELSDGEHKVTLYCNEVIWDENDVVSESNQYSFDVSFTIKRDLDCIDPLCDGYEYVAGKGQSLQDIDVNVYYTDGSVMSTTTANPNVEQYLQYVVDGEVYTTTDIDTYYEYAAINGEMALVYVSAYGLTGTYYISIVESCANLEIISLPYQTEYMQDTYAYIELDGLVLAVTDSEGTVKNYKYYDSDYEGNDWWADIYDSFYYDTSAVNWSEQGEYPVTITCKGKTVSFNISIVECPYGSIELVPTKDCIYALDEVEISGTTWSIYANAFDSCFGAILYDKEGEIIGEYEYVTWLPNYWTASSQCYANVVGEEDVRLCYNYSDYINYGGSYGETEVYLQYCGLNATSTIEVKANPYDHIEIVSLPDETTYLSDYYYGAPDLTGLVIAAYKSEDDENPDIYSYDEEVETTGTVENWKDYVVVFTNGNRDINSMETGEHTATLVFMSMKCDYTIEMVDSLVSSVEVIQLPEKTEYIQNGASYVQLSGLVIAITDLNGNVKNYKIWEEYEGNDWYSDVYEYFSYDDSSVDWSKIGTYPVTINCMGETTTFDISIVESPYGRVELVPKQDTVYAFENFDVDGMSYSYYIPMYDYFTANLYDKEGNLIEAYDHVNWLPDYWSGSNQFGLVLETLNGNTEIYDNAVDYIEGGGSYGTAEVVLNYCGLTATATVNIAENPYNHISILYAPDKTRYQSNLGYSEYPDYTGLVVAAYRSEDDTNPDIYSYDENVETTGCVSNWKEFCAIYTNGEFGICSREAGTYGATLVFMGMKCGFEIEMVDSLVKDFKITKVPDKTEYIMNVDYGMNFAGMEVEITDLDGNVKTYQAYSNEWYEDGISYELSWTSELDWETPGSYIVTLDYLGKEASYEITIVETVVEEFTFDIADGISTFYQGKAYSTDHLDLCGMTYYVSLKDGTVHQGNVFGNWTMTNDDGNSVWYMSLEYDGGYWPLTAEWAYVDEEGYAIVGENALKFTFLNETYILEGITVLENPIESIEIVEEPVRASYLQAEYAADLYGLELLITYKDGTKKTVIVDEHVDTWYVDDGTGAYLTSELESHTISDEGICWKILELSYFNALTELRIDVSPSIMESEEIANESSNKVSLTSEKPYQVYEFVPETSGLYNFFTEDNTDVCLDIYKEDRLVNYWWQSLSCYLEEGTTYHLAVYRSYFDSEEVKEFNVYLSSQVSSLSELEIVGITGVQPAKDSWYDFECVDLYGYENSSYFPYGYDSVIEFVYSNGWTSEFSLYSYYNPTEYYGQFMTVGWEDIDEYGNVVIHDDNALIYDWGEYGSYRVPVTLNVPSPVESIEIVEHPYQDVYGIEAENGDIPGLKVRINYNDGRESQIVEFTMSEYGYVPYSIVVDGYGCWSSVYRNTEPDEDGMATYTLEVGYMNCYITETLELEHSPIQKIVVNQAMDALNETKCFMHEIWSMYGAKISLDGLDFTVTYKDGTTQNIVIQNTGYDSYISVDTPYGETIVNLGRKENVIGIYYMDEFVPVGTVTSYSEYSDAIVMSEGITEVTLEDYNDVAVYKFVPKEDGVYAFTCEERDDLDSYIRIYEESGSFIASMDDSNESMVFNLCAQMKANVPYYIVIQQYESAKEVVFDVTVSQIDVEISPTLITYDGEEHGEEIEVSIKVGDLELVEDENFYVDVELGTEVGRYEVYFYLWGPYYGDAIYYYEIVESVLEAPENVVATLTGHDDATVTWDAVDGADGYHIYYKKSSADEYNTTFKTTTGTSCKFSNLADNTSYDIKVVPYIEGENGVLEGPSSTVVKLTTLRDLAAPTVTVKLTAHDDVKVSWDAVTYAKGYYVYYKKASESSYSSYKTTTGTSLTLADLTDNTSYNFRVIPYGLSGSTKIKSDNYTTKTIKTLRDLKAPTVTVALTAHDDVKVSWKAVSYAEGYYVYYKTSSTSSYSSYKVTTGTSITIKDLADNTKYNFKVIPYGLSGSTKIKSDNYTTKTISTLRSLKAPTVTVKLTAHDDVKVSWKSVSYAEGYYVYYKKSSASSYSSYKTTTGTSITLKNLSDNTKYSFKVVPYGLSGSTKIKSDNYTTKTIKTLRDLAKPSKLTLTASSKTKIKASWSKVSYAEGYYVYYKKSSASSYKLYKTTTGTSITISGLTKNTKYTIKIVPYGISNSSKVLSDNYITKSVTTKKK